MAPELGAAYLVGFLPNFGLTGLHLWLARRRQQSPATQNLQNNLASVNLTWNETKAELQALPLNATKEQLAEKQAHDLEQYNRTALIFGALCAGLSWLGFFFQLLMMASLRFLANPRSEKFLRSSRLCTRADLPTKDVLEILAQLQSLTGHALPQPPAISPSAFKSGE